MCAGCGNRFAKAALVRFTVDESGAGRELILDVTSSSPGRGAYVCPRLECLDKALARKFLQRRLKATGESLRLREEFVRLIEERLH
ncbi:MAG: YlxR family protein [Thermoleophilia bacterium]